MKRALLVGINDYKHAKPLKGGIRDATEIADLLSTHEDGSPNYTCKVLTSPSQEVTRPILRKALETLVDFDGDVLFYFSGHGAPTKLGGCLVTEEGNTNDLGMAMNDVVQLANQSKAREIILILDCCFSGAAGNVLRGDIPLENQAQLREGVTILAASSPTEVAMESGGHGLFTNLVLSALKGGAADVRGNVSAAAIYAYVEAVLGAWDQRPIYKSHAHRLDPVRKCKPAVPDELLRELPKLFAKPIDVYALDPTYEYTDPSAQPEHVEVFQKFKMFRNARLLDTVDDPDLYWAAMHSTAARLTHLGQYYWQLANQGRI